MPFGERRQYGYLVESVFDADRRISFSLIIWMWATRTARWLISGGIRGLRFWES